MTTNKVSPTKLGQLDSSLGLDGARDDKFAAYVNKLLKKRGKRPLHEDEIEALNQYTGNDIIKNLQKVHNRDLSGDLLSARKYAATKLATSEYKGNESLNDALQHMNSWLAKEVVKPGGGYAPNFPLSDFQWEYTAQLDDDSELEEESDEEEPQTIEVDQEVPGAEKQLPGGGSGEIQGVPQLDENDTKKQWLLINTQYIRAQARRAAVLTLYDLKQQGRLGKLQPQFMKNLAYLIKNDDWVDFPGITAKDDLEATKNKLRVYSERVMLPFLYLYNDSPIAAQFFRDVNFQWSDKGGEPMTQRIHEGQGLYKWMSRFTEEKASDYFTDFNLPEVVFQDVFTQFTNDTADDFLRTRGYVDLELVNKEYKIENIPLHDLIKKEMAYVMQKQTPLNPGKQVLADPDAEQPQTKKKQRRTTQMTGAIPNYHKNWDSYQKVLRIMVASFVKSFKPGYKFKPKTEKILEFLLGLTSPSIKPAVVVADADFDQFVNAKGQDVLPAVKIHQDFEALNDTVETQLAYLKKQNPNWLSSLNQYFGFKDKDADPLRTTLTQLSDQLVNHPNDAIPDNQTIFENDDQEEFTLPMIGSELAKVDKDLAGLSSEWDKKAESATLLAGFKTIARQFEEVLVAGVLSDKELGQKAQVIEVDEGPIPTVETQLAQLDPSKGQPGIAKEMKADDTRFRRIAAMIFNYLRGVGYLREAVWYNSEFSNEVAFTKKLNANAHSELNSEYAKLFDKAINAGTYQYGEKGWDKLVEWLSTPEEETFDCEAAKEQYPWLEELLQNSPVKSTMNFKGVTPLKKMNWIMGELRPAFNETMPWFIDALEAQFNGVFAAFQTNDKELSNVTDRWVHDATAALESINAKATHEILSNYAGQHEKYLPQIYEKLQALQNQTMGVTVDNLQWYIASRKGYKVSPQAQVQVDALMNQSGASGANVTANYQGQQLAQAIDEQAALKVALATDPRTQEQFAALTADHNRTVELMAKMAQVQERLTEKVVDSESSKTAKELHEEAKRLRNMEKATLNLIQAAKDLKDIKELDSEAVKKGIQDGLVPLTEALTPIQKLPEILKEPAQLIVNAAQSIQQGGGDVKAAVSKLVENSDALIKGITNELSKERKFKVELDQTELKKVADSIVEIKNSFNEMSLKADKRLEGQTNAVREQLNLVSEKIYSVFEGVLKGEGEKTYKYLNQLTGVLEDFRQFAERAQGDARDVMINAGKQIAEMGKFNIDLQKQQIETNNKLTDALTKDAEVVGKLQVAFDKMDSRYEDLMKKEKEALEVVEKDRKEGRAEWTKGLEALQRFTEQTHQSVKLALESQASTMSASMKQMIIESQLDREAFLKKFEGDKKKELTEAEKLIKAVEEQSRIQADRIEKLITAISNKNANAPANINVAELQITQNNRPQLVDASGRDPGIPTEWLDNLTDLDKVAQSLGSNLFVPVNTSYLAGKAPEPAPTNLLDYNKKLMQEAKTSAAEVHCEQKYELPWEKNTKCSWFDSEKDKLKYQINWLRNHLGLVPLRWAETWIPIDNYTDLVEELLDETEKAAVLAQFTSKVKEWRSKRLNSRLDSTHLGSFWGKLIDLEMKLALDRKEKRFKKRLVNWVLGNGVRGEYKECWWIPKDEQNKPALFSKLQAFFKPETELEDGFSTKWKTYLIDRNPDILWGMVKKYNDHKKKKQEFLTTLQRTVPKNDEELYLFYKYVIKKKLLARFNERTRNDTPYPADTPKLDVTSTQTLKLSLQLNKGINPVTVQQMGRRLFELQFEGPKKKEWANDNKDKLENLPD